MIHPNPAPDAPRPHLTIVPPSGAPSPSDAPPMPTQPTVTLDEIDQDEARRQIAPVPLDAELGITDEARFPNFLPPSLGTDTIFTAQPHWISDAKGEPFTFRLNPGLARLITIIVESSATPYTTKSDFFRDAAYYLARAIRDLMNVQDARLDSLLQEADLRADSDYEAKLQEEVLEFEHNLTDALIGCLERGALAEACRKLTAFWNQTDAIEIPHRRRAHQEVLLDSPLIQAVLTLGQSRGFAVPTAALAPVPQAAQPAV